MMSHISLFGGRVCIILLFLVLLAANVITFARTVQISDEIVKLESKTLVFARNNAQLEQQVYTQNSITNLVRLAKQLGFTKQSEPVILDTSEYALVP